MKFTTNFKAYLNDKGLPGFISLLFYPVILIVHSPYRIFQMLTHSVPLMNGKWGDYSGLQPSNAINHLFYWTRALNIYKYGRNGTSPYMGLGNYHLSRTFHYSLFSLYLFWIAPVVLVIISQIIWLTSHFVWVTNYNVSWVSSIVIVTFISSTYYYNFIKQNYNMFGWAFFPLILYALFNGQFVLASIFLLLASFGSITVIFLSGFILFFRTIEVGSLLPIITIIPALLNIATHFIPLFTNQTGLATLTKVMKAIGLSKKNVKYKRTKTQTINRTTIIYYILIYLQFILIYFYTTGEWNLYLIIGFFIHIINSSLFRFADLQSIRIFFLSIAVFSIISQPFNYLLLLSFWILASPLPAYLSLAKKNKPHILQQASPFKIKPILKAIDQFIKPVPENQRIFMAFDNPQNTYENIFDGYRKLVEVIHYISNKNNIHFMPDWWGVFELNYPGAPEIWDRNIESVKSNLKNWNADYVIIYQPSNTELENNWIKEGFQVVNEIDWKILEPLFNKQLPYKGVTPKWWLLKPPS